MNRRAFDINCTQEDPVFGTVDVSATGYCTKDTPGTMYDRHGDPGNAPESGETEFESVVVTNENEVVLYDLTRKANDTEPDWDDLRERAYNDAFGR